jgi:hypothetical protein
MRPLLRAEQRSTARPCGGSGETCVRPSSSFDTRPAIWRTGSDAMYVKEVSRAGSPSGRARPATGRSDGDGANRWRGLASAAGTETLWTFERQRLVRAA